MIRYLLLLVLFIFVSAIQTKAQYTYGTTGLLNMPTADMQCDKTFMCGGSYLEKSIRVQHDGFMTHGTIISI